MTACMALGQDRYNYFNELTRLRNLLTEMQKPIIDRMLTDFVLQGLAEEYRGVPSPGVILGSSPGS